MTNWVSLKESIINIDSVQSFHISNKEIIFYFNNHKVDWKFDSNEEAQKVFIYLQKKINADISQTKEFADAIENIKAKIIEIEPEATITVENKRIIVYMLRDSFIAYSNSIKNNITHLCEEIGYQLFTDIIKTTQNN